MSTYLTSAASHTEGHAFVIDLGRTAPESVAAEPSTSVHPTNSGDKGKGKESQNPHPPERSGSVSEHHVSVGSYPIVSGPLAMTPGSSKVAAEPSTVTGMQRQNSGSEQPTSSDKGKGKEKQTPLSPQRSGSVSGHVPAANLPGPFHVFSVSESGSTKPLTDPNVKPGPFHVFSMSDSDPAKPLIDPKAVLKQGPFHVQTFSASGPLAETPGPSKVAAKPSTKTGKRPPTIDKGKDSEKEKQTPHSPERSGSVSMHHEGIHIPADLPKIVHPQTSNSERTKATPLNRSTSSSGTAGKPPSGPGTRPSRKAQGKR